MSFTGSVEAVHIVTVRGETPLALDSVEAVAGKGLINDVYFEVMRGGKLRPDKAITFIAIEELEAAEARGMVWAPGESRRNITTRGVPLNDLIGKRFRVGEVLVEGSELCEPCAKLEKWTGKPVLAEMMGRSGLRAYILEGGHIRIGDAIAPVLD